MSCNAQFASCSIASFIYRVGIAALRDVTNFVACVLVTQKTSEPQVQGPWAAAPSPGEASQEPHQILATQALQK